MMLHRREALAAVTVARSSVAETSAIVVDPKPLFEISPWLYSTAIRH